MKLGVLILTLITATSFTSYTYAASSEYGPFKVSALRPHTDALYIQFSPAPLACNGGSHYRMHAKIQYTVNNYNTIASILIASHTTGNMISYIFFTDLPAGATQCSNVPGEMLQIYSIEQTPK